jgi:hypothetical protein
MHPTHLLAAGAVAAVAFLLRGGDAAAAPPAPPAAQPVGHYVLVVEGHREQLAITAASAKPDPWGGVPKGFDSAWRLRVTDAGDAVLADVPLDVRPFDVEAGALLRKTRVEGCIVTSPAIGMLVNVPQFAAAARYTFTRPGGPGEAREHLLGVVDAAAVRALAGGGR